MSKPSPSPKKDSPNESSITVILDSSGECNTRDESSTLLLDDDNYMDVDEKTSEELEKEFQMELQDSAEKQDKKEEKDNNKSPANKKRRSRVYEPPQGIIKDVADMFTYATKNKKKIKKKAKESAEEFAKEMNKPKKLKF